MPQLKPTRGIRLNKSHHISRGLVGCWLFNEGSGGQVFDLSGNGHTGTLQADTHFAPGKFGSGLSFDGTGDYVGLADTALLNPSSQLTIVVWAYNTKSANQVWVGKEGSGTNRSYYLRQTNTSGIYIGFILSEDGSAFSAWQSGNAVYPLNEWIQIAAVYNSAESSPRLYVNGALVAGSWATGAMPASLYDNSEPLSFGVRRASGTPADYFEGKLDHVMMWNRSLSSSEIALLYREPFCMFERAWIPKLIGGQIVNLAGNSVALSSLSATAKAMRKVGGNVVSTSDVAAILNLIRSLLYIESNWKREALFNGMTANAFKLGTTLSLGWFWVRVAGCSVLYRGSSMGEIDFVNILVVAEQDAREISPPSYISHNSGSTYFYVVRRFNDCGYQERTLAASVKVSIESNGELAEPQPNKVFDSGAELVDGNKILLVWYYCPLEQKSQPMCFNVYYDGRTGQINYENPLAIIGYKGREFYSYQCGALEAGRYLFAIRTENASGIENSSLARLRIQFDPTNPAAIDILSVEGV